MWPPEHLAVGYVCYSAYSHLRYRRPPSAAATVAVVLATQLPDVIDKTLAWTFDVLPSGHSLGHSLLFAVPLWFAVALAARLAGRPDVGSAFGIAYLSHLPGDVVYPLLIGRDTTLSFLFWPLTPAPTGEPDGGFVELFVHYATRYVELVLAGEVTGYVVAQLMLVGGVLVLWLYDGAPVATQLVALGSRFRRSERERDAR